MQSFGATWSMSRGRSVNITLSGRQILRAWCPQGVVQVNDGVAVEPLGDAAVIRHDSVPSGSPAPAPGLPMVRCPDRGPPSVGIVGPSLPSVLVMPAAAASRRVASSGVLPNSLRPAYDRKQSHPDVNRRVRPDRLSRLWSRVLPTTAKSPARYSAMESARSGDALACACELRPSG